MVDILAELESKLNGIDEKIISKTKSINDLYDTDVDKLNNRFSNFEIEAEILNNHRSGQLLRLTQNRNELLDVFNTFIKDITKNSFIEDAIELVKQKSELINQNLIELTQVRRSNYKNISNKVKFSKPLDLCSLNKYSSLINTKKKLKLELPVGHYLQYINFEEKIFIRLPNGRYFIHAQKGSNTKLLILNKDGLIEHSKSLELKEAERINVTFKVSSTRIAHMYKYEFGMDRGLVNVYNFNLDLMGTFRLSNAPIFYNIIVKKDELAYRSIKDTKVLVFNMETLKLNDIKYNSNNNTGSFDYMQFILVHLDEHKLFFLNRNKCISIVDRSSGNEVLNLPSRINHLDMVKFDEYSRIYIIEPFEYMIRVYDSSNGSLLTSFMLKEDFSPFIFTINDTIIYNINNERDKLIEFNEY